MDRTLNLIGTKLLIIIFRFAVLAGVILILIQFFANRSLFIDEANLALNIVNRDFKQLLKPLDASQVAPILFLVSEKLVAGVFGNTDWSLRIVPLFAVLFSLPLLYWLAYRLTESRVYSLLVIAFFSFNTLIVYYASELKQYSVDILIGLVVFNLAVRFNPRKARSVVAFMILGSVAIWLSNIAVIMLFVAGVYILVKYWRERLVFLLLLIWGVSFFSYYYYFIHGHPTKGLMLVYWQGCFMPTDFLSKDFFFFIFKACKDFYFSVFGFGRFWYIPLAISIGGVLSLWQDDKKDWLFLLLSPFIVHLVISGFKQYPFQGRFLLYLLPSALLLFVSGLFYLFEVANRLFRISALFLLVPLLFMLLPFRHGFPMRNEEIKDALEYLDRSANKNEKLYVYYATVPAFEFYSSGYSTVKELNYVKGSINRDSWNKYVEEILDMDNPIWLLFSHSYPFDTQETEEIFIIEKLKEKQVRIILTKKYHGASLYRIMNNSLEGTYR